MLPVEADFNKLSGVIVGLGSIGNRHLNNCLELGVGQMSVVRRPNSNSQFSPPDGVSVVHSIAEALQSKPDFAIVCNPSHLHASTAIEFLEGNCHVKPEPEAFDYAIKETQCEKSECGFVAHDIDELEGSQAHQLFAIGYNYHPDAPADLHIENFSELT